jgi:hypothetical protein
MLCHLHDVVDFFGRCDSVFGKTVNAQRVAANVCLSKQPPSIVVSTLIGVEPVLLWLLILMCFAVSVRWIYGFGAIDCAAGLLGAEWHVSVAASLLILVMFSCQSVLCLQMSDSVSK